MDNSTGFGGVFKAVYGPLYNVTVQNSFVGISDGGIVKINNITYNAPATVQVVEGGNVKVEIPDQVINYIKYRFDHWSDNNTQNPRTFSNITIPFTITAIDSGKPVHVTNMQVNGSNYVVGDPIYITWDEHPNTNVTQYYVMRKVKHSRYYSYEGPDTIAILNRGTTSYHDYDYTYTSGYSDDLLQYDIWAKYSIENSFSDSNYTATFGVGEGGGRILPKANDAGKDIIAMSKKVPTEYKLDQNYPNPFNPWTSIPFSLPERAEVQISIFNLRGEEVAHLLSGSLEAGHHVTRWNASQTPSGLYLVKMEANERSVTRKITVLK